MIEEKPPLIWLNVMIFALTALIALIGVPWYAWQVGFEWYHLGWFLITFSFCNLSITAGYHRLWSHKAYQTKEWIRVVFALGGAFALQNSALHWSSDHRPHHKFVDDNQRDPYSAKRGFWYSHIGWMLRHYNHACYDDYANCRDLQKDRVVMWQHRHYIPLAIATNFGIPLLLGLIYGDVLGMLLVVGIVRLVLSHHSTFFINSLAHIWGSQPYTTRNTARDNGVLAVFTFGEGYHNFHHIFEGDYRNGVRWWQYDPTKWLIASLARCGLASNLRITPNFRIEKARALAKLSKAKDHLAQRPNCQYLMTHLQTEYEQLIAKMGDYYDLKKRLLESKKHKLSRKYELSVAKLECEQMKRRFIEQRARWNALVGQYA